LGLTDELPTPLVIAATPNASTTCPSGSVTATPGSNQAVLSGGELNATSNCQIRFDITLPDNPAYYGNSYTNTIPIGSVTTIEGVSNLEADSSNITIYEPGLGMTGSKSFTSSVINSGENSRLRITLNSPQDQAITNLSITDNLPAGVYITNSTTASTSGCGAGSLTANTGESTISYTGGSIAKNSQCQINVYVTSDDQGAYVNSIDPASITTGEGETVPNAFSATLRVSDLTMSKAFYPTTVSPGGYSTLTITLTNTNPIALLNTSLTDNLNTMGGSNVVIAPTPNASTTCPGGTVTAVSGTQSIQLTGASIPAQVDGVPGICTINVDVQGNGIQTTRTNTIYTSNVEGTVQGTSTQVSPKSNATAQLKILNLGLEVVKGFQPSTVFGGSSSTMSIELINPNNVELTGIALIDNMPAGMYIANPTNMDEGICGGTLVGNPGDSSFTYSGGYLPANSRCVLRLSATMNVNGNLTNTIQAGEVTSFNGASNAQPSATTLTNLPGVSVIKYFNPSTILGEPGQYSLLTIELENRTNIPLTGMGVIDTLPGTLPAGLFIASSPAATTDCGGSLTAAAGTQHIELNNGSLAGYETCKIEVPVSSTVSGEYINIIPKSTIVTVEEASNKEEARDTLKVNASPEMQISKDVASTGPYAEDDPITFIITVFNKGDIDLSNVQITDPGADVTLGACTPASGSTLAPGESMSCTATHTATADDVSNDEFTNTAFGDSDQTDPVSDDETVRLSAGPAISVTKLTTSSGPYELNDTITYQIRAKNIGTTNLTNVQVTDPGTNVTLGSCTPVSGSTLAPGTSMTCSATHAVTQIDVDAGEFTNTAFADSDETDPASDSVTVPVNQDAKLSVYKEAVTDPPYNVGNTVNYEIIVLNSGNQTLHNVVVSDVGTGVTFGSCDKSAPVTLNVGEYMTCTASYVVQQANIDDGSFTNTAVADSDETGPTEGKTTIEFDQMPSIELTKTGTLNMNVIAPNDEANVGDTITYTFAVRNTGNVTLKDVTVTDKVGGVTISGGPLASLAIGTTDNSTFTGTYTLTQADIDAGTFTNTATATGEYGLENKKVTDDDDDTQTWDERAMIGIAKRVVGSPAKVSAGTWDVTYEILVRNYGNVTLSNLQVTDVLSTVFSDPNVLVGVQSLTSADFSINWPGYNGIAGTGDTHLLTTGANSLAAGESGTLTLVVRVIPANNGPFENSATATGEPPEGVPVSDVSQDGTNPDPEPSDGDPTNNSEPTPVNFGANLFDPPSGEKTVNAAGLPVLQWSMVWINDTNILAINARAVDELPEGTTFDDTGISSGYPMPGGVLPTGSTDTGVTCVAPGSTSTTTTYCYFEGPSATYPRGRIIWEAT
jgi:uncharacterized repeat protein (TIGR01451 family)